MNKNKDAFWLNIVLDGVLFFRIYRKEFHFDFNKLTREIIKFKVNENYFIFKNTKLYVINTTSFHKKLILFDF